MDKYELTIKIDKLDKLVKNRDYVNAAKVADQLEWKKMKQWSVMSNAIDAFVATGNYEKVSMHITASSEEEDFLLRLWRCM